MSRATKRNKTQGRARNGAAFFVAAHQCGAPRRPAGGISGNCTAPPIFRLHPAAPPPIDPTRGGADALRGPHGGAIAQLVERLNGIQEVRGSIPLGSTIRLFMTFQTADPTRKAGLSRRRSRSLAASGAASSPAGERPGATASYAPGRGGPVGIPLDPHVLALHRIAHAGNRPVDGPVQIMAVKGQRGDRAAAGDLDAQKRVDAPAAIGRGLMARQGFVRAQGKAQRDPVALTPCGRARDRPAAPCHGFLPGPCRQLSHDAGMVQVRVHAVGQGRGIDRPHHHGIVAPGHEGQLIGGGMVRVAAVMRLVRPRGLHQQDYLSRGGVKIVQPGPDAVPVRLQGVQIHTRRGLAVGFSLDPEIDDGLWRAPLPQIRKVRAVDDHVVTDQPVGLIQNGDGLPGDWAA